MVTSNALSAISAATIGGSLMDGTLSSPMCSRRRPSNHVDPVVATQFSPTEVRLLHDRFSKVANPLSGKIGPVEFKRYIEEFCISRTHAPMPSTEMYTHLFRGYDRDNDGLITLDDFLHFSAVHAAGADPFPEEYREIIFRIFDADRDGVITRDDVLGVIAKSIEWFGAIPFNFNGREFVDPNDDVFHVVKEVKDVDRITEEELRNADARANGRVLPLLMNYAQGWRHSGYKLIWEHRGFQMHKEFLASIKVGPLERPVDKFVGDDFLRIKTPTSTNQPSSTGHQIQNQMCYCC